MTLAVDVCPILGAEGPTVDNLLTARAKAFATGPLANIAHAQTVCLRRRRRTRPEWLVRGPSFRRDRVARLEDNFAPAEFSSLALVR